MLYYRLVFSVRSVLSDGLRLKAASRRTRQLKTRQGTPRYCEVRQGMLPFYQITKPSFHFRCHLISYPLLHYRLLSCIMSFLVVYSIALLFDVPHYRSSPLIFCLSRSQGSARQRKARKDAATARRGRARPGKEGPDKEGKGKRQAKRRPNNRKERHRKQLPFLVK